MPKPIGRGFSVVALRRLVTVRGVLAAGAGVALGCAYPRVGVAGLAWVAPGLMLAAACGVSNGRALRLGYGAGLAFALVSLHWLLFIPFPAGAVAGWLALSAYVALYFAVWVWLCVRVLLPRAAGRGSTIASGGGGVGGICPSDAVEAGGADGAVAVVAAWRERLWDALAPLHRLGGWQRAWWCLAGGAAWVAVESILGRLFGGFAWNPLGVSQYESIPLIQIASITGVGGVSFLVAWTSLALLSTAARFVALVGPGPRAAIEAVEARREAVFGRGFGGQRSGGAFDARGLGRGFGFAVCGDAVAPLMVLLGCTLWGARVLWEPVPAGSTLKVAAVQPSIPQRLIFDPREATNRFHALMDLSRAALAVKPDLLVWPEASLPGFEEEHYRALTNLVASHRVWMVFGADDVEPRVARDGVRIEYDSYNGAFLFGPDGRFRATYRKQHLVIFGEYIPFERWLPFAKYLTPIEGSFRPGPGPVPFRLEDPPVTCAVLICFEDVFAQHARDATVAEPATDFLLNLTNNGWFGESAAQWQHAANSVFRAIENRRPLVRCANNGLTCWVDSFGRIRDAGFGAPDDIYRAGFKLFEIPRRGADSPAPTFYQAHGDVFAWGCLGVTAVLGVACALRHRQSMQNGRP